MRKKEWYTVKAECIKESATITAKKGDKMIVAKVKSYGLAYVAAMAISETLGEYFAITID